MLLKVINKNFLNIILLDFISLGEKSWIKSFAVGKMHFLLKILNREEGEHGKIAITFEICVRSKSTKYVISYATFCGRLLSRIAKPLLSQIRLNDDHFCQTRERITFLGTHGKKRKHQGNFGNN